MIRIAAVVLVVVVAGCAWTRDKAYTFTELMYPGATSTVASAINDAGHVAGWYKQGDRTFGFTYKDGTWATVQYPGASLTQLTSIAAGGGVSGAYRMPDEKSPMAFHGFLMAPSGGFRTIAHPDYAYSMAMRVLGDGSVVGCYHKEDGIPSMRSVTIPAAAITEAGVTPAALRFLDTAGSMHNGATPDGTKVVGMVSTTGDAYIIDRGALSMFRMPEAKRTEAWDVNTAGAIVGTFDDSASVSHGFVRENGRDTIVDYPNAKGTIALGINAHGTIVGAYEGADGQRRGYLARR